MFSIPALLCCSCRLAGDFGFDPLGLGEDPESLKWYVQAELVHSRFAMAGVAGILVTDVSHQNHEYHVIYCGNCSQIAESVSTDDKFLTSENCIPVIPSCFFLQLLRVTGLSGLPVWYEAGATKFDFANTTTLFIVQLLLMGYLLYQSYMHLPFFIFIFLYLCCCSFVETKRYMDFRNPGSQAKEGSFFGLEAALEGLEPG